MKFCLYRGPNDEMKLVGTYDSIKEANAAMVHMLANEGIHPYYYRVSGDPEGNQWIDYGSHSSFFEIRVKEED